MSPFIASTLLITADRIVRRPREPPECSMPNVTFPNSQFQSSQRLFVRPILVGKYYRVKYQAILTVRTRILIYDIHLGVRSSESFEELDRDWY